MTKALAAAYSATGGEWARGPERIYERLADVMVGCLQTAFEGRDIVDVGAGTGAGGRAALRAGASSVVAVDAAFGMLAHDARSRPAAVTADALHLPFVDGAFGGAIAAFSLNHVATPADGLREMARVTRPGSPLLVSAYAADDSHPVKAAVEGALVAAGWAPPDWYDDLRQRITPLLSTVKGFREALAGARLDDGARVESLRVSFDDLSAHDLVTWRLGMAQHAPFVTSLTPAVAGAVHDDALSRLGPEAPPLVRSVLVASAVSR